MRSLLKEIIRIKEWGETLDSDQICSNFNVEASYIDEILERIEEDEYILKAVNYCINNNLQLDAHQIKIEFKMGSNRAERIYQFLDTYYFSNDSVSASTDEFDYLNEMYSDEDYNGFISEFESNQSLLCNKLDLVKKYIFSLYKVDDRESEAIEIAEDALINYPNDETLHLYLGHLYSYNNDLKKSREHYLKSNDREYIDKINNKIATEDAYKAELLRKKHSFKSSRGILFCKYCGVKNMYAKSICEGRDSNHNYILMKNQANDWIPVCSKCGKDGSFSFTKCS